MLYTYMHKICVDIESFGKRIQYSVQLCDFIIKSKATLGPHPEYRRSRFLPQLANSSHQYENSVLNFPRKSRIFQYEKENSPVTRGDILPFPKKRKNFRIVLKKSVGDERSHSARLWGKKKKIKP